jgi:hypothetical protein
MQKEDEENCKEKSGSQSERQREGTCSGEIYS